MKAAQLLSCANSMFGWLRLRRGRKAGRERDFEWMQALWALQSQRQLTSSVLNIRGDVWRALPSVL